MCKFSKYVYKLIPCSMWQIGEIESWLSDMASDGLILKSFGVRFAKFEKSQPCNLRYRLDFYSLSGKMPKEQILAYKESGWNLCCSSGNFYFFNSLEDNGIPELHTDATEQGYSLEYLNKKLFRLALGSIFTLILIVALYFFSFSLTKTYYLSLLNFALFFNLFIVLPLILFNYSRDILNTFYISKLKKSLIQGQPINHKADWKNRSIYSSKLEFLIISAWTIVCVTTFFLNFANSDFPKTLPKDTSSLPIVRLSEIEETPYIDWNNPLLSESDKPAWYSTDWSPLAPLHYNFYETGIIEEISSSTGELTNKLNSNGTAPYEPLIYGDAYKITFQSMVDNILLDLIKARNMPNEITLGRITISNNATPLGNVSKINNKNFDLLYVNNNKTKIFASRGKGIICVEYTGEADFDRILEVISEKLKLIE